MLQKWFVIQQIACEFFFACATTSTQTRCTEGFSEDFRESIISEKLKQAGSCDNDSGWTSGGALFESFLSDETKAITKPLSVSYRKHIGESWMKYFLCFREHLAVQ